MLQLLTDFCQDLFKSLQATGWMEEIVGSALVFILLILLADTIRRRRKGGKPEAVTSNGLAAEMRHEDTGRQDAKEKIGISNLQNQEAQKVPEITSQPSMAPADKPDSTPAGPEMARPETKEVSPDEPGRLMNRLKTGLSKTRKSLGSRLERVFAEKTIIDEQTIEEIEEALITADVGMETTMELVSRIQANSSQIASPAQLRSFLKQEMLRVFDNMAQPAPIAEKPHVIMVVGVNGVGKTTTIGKLAYRFQTGGHSVLMGAADTFRAAAVEQLTIWAQRAGAEIVSHRQNADPAAVAYDAVEAGTSRGADRIIIDTAGRLHTKVNLMEQLKKIKRSIAKKMPGAPHEVLLVLDATTGQNAIAQAKMFHEGVGITGLILTKLDGTAKGGIVVGICNTMKLPLHYIGVGESMEDLQPFNPKLFIDALF